MLLSLATLVLLRLRLNLFNLLITLSLLLLRYTYRGRYDPLSSKCLSKLLITSLNLMFLELFNKLCLLLSHLLRDCSLPLIKLLHHRLSHPLLIHNLDSLLIDLPRNFSLKDLSKHACELPHPLVE